MKDAFEICVERKLMRDGSLQIHCRLGLWGTSGQDHKQVERDARHYWIQYYQDGEYKQLFEDSP